MEFRKKPVLIKATQWNKNGDHPLDGVGMEAPDGIGGVYQRVEGAVVRFYRTPDMDGQTTCKYCGNNAPSWVD